MTSVAAAFSDAMQRLFDVVHDIIADFVSALESFIEQFLQTMNTETYLIESKVDELVEDGSVVSANAWVQDLGESDYREKLLAYLAREYTVMCVTCENEMFYNENTDGWFCAGCND